MWRAIYQLDVPVAEKIIRPLLVYTFLVVALRIAGKQVLSQLSSLDFVVLLAVANAVRNGIIGDDSTVTGGLIGATTLFVHHALGLPAVPQRRLQHLVEGSPTVLVKNCIVDHDALHREQITMEQLVEEIHAGGAASIEEIGQAELTPSGKIVTGRQATRHQRPALRSPHTPTRRTEDQHRRPRTAITSCTRPRHQPPRATQPHQRPT